MAFMFESHYVLKLSEYALSHNQTDYNDCWKGLKNQHTEFIKKHQ